VNIYQKIIEVRKLVDFLVKDEQGYQYKYVSGSSLLNTIRPKMDELGLLLITDVVKSTHNRYEFEGVDNKGNAKTFVQFVVNMDLTFTWIDADNPEERIVCKWISSGEDEDPAKAEGKAHTYGERYFGLKFFKVATDNEDPDATQKPKVQVQTITKSAPTDNSMMPHVEKLAKEKFKTPDTFKTWRVDNGFAENLKGLSDLDLAVIWNKMKTIK
jgi:hypothetical protein